MSARGRPTVAVIGGGFSGLMTALHLLADPDGPRVHLIERRRAFGRGTAYADRSPDHLLNVRAGNMSAWPSRPSHFADWLELQGLVGTDTIYAQRGLYGRYLQAQLQAATDRADGRLSLEPDAAVALVQADERWRVRLALGQEIAADAIVLALGNMPPRSPPGLEPECLHAAGYVGDPWSDRLAELPDEGLVVLVGAGLTMIDVALRIERERPGLRMLALSRRGLLPRSHQQSPPPPRPWAPASPLTVRGVMRELRARAQASGDWRGAMEGLRPHVQAVWRGWPSAERRRFLRHARPWWDVHRHRIAPPIARRLDGLMASGVLRVCAGRLRRISCAGEALKVSWTPRGGGEPRRETAVAVVNCTGPDSDLARCRDPLMRSLADAGLARGDELALGLDVDDSGRVRDAVGKVSRTLFAVGPATKGHSWEITAVPDIRVQAAACARAVGAALAG